MCPPCKPVRQFASAVNQRGRQIAATIRRTATRASEHLAALRRRPPLEPESQILLEEMKERRKFVRGIAQLARSESPLRDMSRLDEHDHIEALLKKGSNDNGN